MREYELHTKWECLYLSVLRIRIRSDPDLFGRIRIRYIHTYISVTDPDPDPVGSGPFWSDPDQGLNKGPYINFFRVC
jgi:hypothetical protein